ncbi:hypothetical protein PR048_002902 [Dryococelus australis]|uniref:Uncharacterized protein n=1 Tax=Dryococelus australis TaxID=614101 RepID=A0ABQ9ILH4_9NEOP|nr:hypothetical protein PR048_002902 [Dryococelus australis]
MLQLCWLLVWSVGLLVAPVLRQHYAPVEMAFLNRAIKIPGPAVVLAVNQVYVLECTQSLGMRDWPLEHAKHDFETGIPVCASSHLSPNARCPSQLRQVVQDAECATLPLDFKFPQPKYYSNKKACLGQLYRTCYCLRVIRPRHFAGLCRWSAIFLRDLPSPPPLHSEVAPYSPLFTLIGSQDLDNHEINTSIIGAAVAERLACSPSTKANRFQSPAGSLRIFVSGNRAGRCRWSLGFLGDLPFRPPLHSSAAPFSPHFTLIGSQDLAFKSRPNISTPPVSPPCPTKLPPRSKRSGTAKFTTALPQLLR